MHACVIAVAVYIRSTPNTAARRATPDPALSTLPSPVLLAGSVAADPLAPALVVAPAPVPAPALLAETSVAELPPEDAVDVTPKALGAKVLLAVNIGGGKLVVAGPLTLATSI